MQNAATNWQAQEGIAERKVLWKIFFKIWRLKKLRKDYPRRIPPGCLGRVSCFRCVDGFGVISPSCCALAMAAARLFTSSFRYALESRLRTVELLTAMMFAKRAVVLFG